MEEVFTDEELKIAKEVVTLGLVNATNSLEFFVKSKTRLELGNDFSVSEIFSTEHLSKQSGEIYLLTTELIGDLKGVSFLLFSEDEVEMFMKNQYPNKQFDEAKYNKKSKSLILEIDNIITAGVMSQFANSFEYKTYGGVPKLDVLDYDSAIKVIMEATEKNEFIIGFKAVLISEKSNIKADFVWSVDNAFVEGVKSLV